MRRIIQIEWLRMKKIYLLGIGLALIYSILMILIKQDGYSYDYNIELWIESNELLGLLFPAMAVIPTCWSMYYERKNNYLKYVALRASKTKYIFVKWIMTASYGGFLIFSVSFSGVIITCLMMSQMTSSDSSRALQEFMGTYLVNNPLIYGLSLSLWRGFIGFLVTTMAFVLSLYVDNIFIILTGPFIYSILENFIFAILNVPYFRLVTSFSPYLLTASSISFYRLLVGPIFLILITLIVLLYYSLYVKKRIF